MHVPHCYPYLFVHARLDKATATRSSFSLYLIAVRFVLWDELEVLVGWSKEHFTMS